MQNAYHNLRASPCTCAATAALICASVAFSAIFAIALSVTHGAAFVALWLCVALACEALRVASPLILTSQRPFGARGSAALTYIATATLSAVATIGFLQHFTDENALTAYASALGLPGEALALLIVALVELGSAWGLVIARAEHRDAPAAETPVQAPEKPSQSEAAQKLLRLVKEAGGALTASQRALATEMRTTPSAVHRAIGELRDAGALLVETSREGTALRLA